MKIAYVKWIDSTQFKKVKGGEESSVDIDEIESAGLVVRETPDMIALSPHWNHTPDTWDSPITIPKCSIKAQ